MSEDTIRSLQHMLMMIDMAEGAEEPLSEDGAFGPATEKAVQSIQNRRGLKPTGIVDEETFSAIVSEYERVAELLHPAQSCVMLFPAALTIYPGQSHPHVGLAQAMMHALGREFPEFASVRLSGLLDAPTEQNLRLIQRCAGLPEHGALDKITWNRMSMLYRALFDRCHIPSQG